MADQASLQVIGLHLHQHHGSRYIGRCCDGRSKYWCALRGACLSVPAPQREPASRQPTGGFDPGLGACQFRPRFQVSHAALSGISRIGSIGSPARHVSASSWSQPPYRRTSVDPQSCRLHRNVTDRTSVLFPGWRCRHSRRVSIDRLPQALHSTHKMPVEIRTAIEGCSGRGGKDAWAMSPTKR